LASQVRPDGEYVPIAGYVTILPFQRLPAERACKILKMLLRSLRVPPSLLLLVVFLVFFGWQLSQGPRHEEGPLGSQVIPGEKKAPRIALMTFVTEQRSYLHLSLKNKDRKFPQPHGAGLRY
jgi:hypothetical protein